MTAAVSAYEVSAAAHRALPHANPLTAAQMDALAQEAAARSPRTAVEIGCGPGTFAIALAARTGVAVAALDINPHFLVRARAAAAQTALVGRVDFLQQPADAFAGAPVDLVVCIGASQALGTPCEALATTARWLHPGGTLVFAELFWESPPPAAFLDFLGVAPDRFWPKEAARAAFAQAGLSVQTQTHADHAAWDVYETEVLRGRLALADTLPPEDAEPLRARATDWFETRGQYGECLGFGAWIATRTGD